MYRFIKFKKLDDFSLDDLNNCTASFGLFSIFFDQHEFDGLVDSKYLNEKYNDSSITDKNVIEVIVKHINEQYLQFSLAKLSDEFNYEDVMPKMYKDYCGGNGFVLYYEFNNVQEVYSYFKGMYPLFIDIQYEKDGLNLTGFYDCLLQCADEDNFDDARFQELLDENGYKDDLLHFMARKTHYPKRYENESRIIIRKNDKMNITGNHFSVPFAKPTTVCIPHSLSEKDKYKLIKICNKNRIEYKFIGYI